MRAVVLEKPIEANELKVSEVPMPQVKPGWVLVRIKAFGINRSELFTRKGQSPSVSLPRIIGIECAGEIADPSDTSFTIGQPVVSMGGGLGRAFDGSYADYTLIPSGQVFPVTNVSSWPQLAALPILYTTAWRSLVDILKLQAGEHLLIRGGTSSIGIAATQIASAMGVYVSATTRSHDKKALLESYGVSQVFIDDDTLDEQIFHGLKNGADKILELVGATTLSSSFQHLKPGGTLCMTGILSGKWTLDQFAPMDTIPEGTYFTVYSGLEIPQASWQAMHRFIDAHNLTPPIAEVFPLSEIVQAHTLMESNTANGKIIVTTQEKGC